MRAVRTVSLPRAWSHVFLCGAFLIPLVGPRHGFAYTPDSPEVKAMLTRGLGWLNGNVMISTAERLGGRCLVGLVEYKYNARFGDFTVVPPMTQLAVELVRTKSGSLSGVDNYSLGLALILLCEVHPEDNSQTIELYLRELLSRQKPHGGWGYDHLPTGDLSQLQYAVLALWSVKNAGVEIDNRVMADVVDFVLRVQDPSGAWGYQGNDPRTHTRIAQSQVRPSLAAAGLGTLYVGADFLGMSKKGKPRTISTAATRLPAALVPVVEEDQRRPEKPTSSWVDVDYLRAAMNDGNEYFRQLPSVNVPMYPFYFLYGYERYHSFREQVEGQVEDEPQWYNDGVRWLQEVQHESGYWGMVPGVGMTAFICEKPIATSFAMLFLLRSTQQSITKSMDRDGILRGGYGLPSDLTEVRMQGNRIVAPAITGEVQDLIGMLEDEEGEKIENLLENPDALSLSSREGDGHQYTERLTRVLRTGSYKARMVAARALGRQGTLSNVPILIYALTDPDVRVMREARDALRQISRKFDGFSLSDNPTPSEVGLAVSQWKTWYQGIQPDAEFIE